MKKAPSQLCSSHLGDSGDSDITETEGKTFPRGDELSECTTAAGQGGGHRCDALGL